MCTYLWITCGDTPRLPARCLWTSVGVDMWILLLSCVDGCVSLCSENNSCVERLEPSDFEIHSGLHKTKAVTAR